METKKDNTESIVHRSFFSCARTTYNQRMDVETWFDICSRLQAWMIYCNLLCKRASVFGIARSLGICMCSVQHCIVINPYCDPGHPERSSMRKTVSGLNFVHRSGRDFEGLHQTP